MDLLIGDIFTNAARAVPHRTAAALDGRTITFGGVESGANRMAGALGRNGIARGDRVAVWSATSLDLIPLFAALAKIGAVFAPLSAALGMEEALETVALCRPALLVVDADRAEAGWELAGRLGIPMGRIDGLAGGQPAPPGPGLDLVALAAMEDDAGLPLAGLAERDAHVVFFTSGSTGRPKGAVLSHRVNFLRSHPGALLEPRGAMVCPYPLFHMGAWTIALQQWQARDCVVFVASAAAATICEAVERHAATRLNCIPAVWRRILDHLGRAEGHHRTMPSLRFADTGTSATPLELLTAIEDVAPQAGVRVFYGSTEAGSVATLEHADIPRKPGSCGVPGPFTEVRTDRHGELWVRGPLLFDGYFADEDATRHALVDGWYRTGDLAEVDSDGYLTIVGRVGDFIRTGGESVLPAEVEAALAGHPRVGDVAVVGLPDAQWGELVCAVVVPVRDGPPPTLEELRAHCDSKLAAFKHPRRLALVERIPRTVATSQIQRSLLVDRLG